MFFINKNFVVNKFWLGLNGFYFFYFLSSYIIGRRFRRKLGLVRFVGLRKVVRFFGNVNSIFFFVEIV